MAQIKIELAGPRTRVWVDGVEQESVTDLELRVSVHEPPTLRLTMLAIGEGGSVEGAVEKVERFVLRRPECQKEGACLCDFTTPEPHCGLEP